MAACLIALISQVRLLWDDMHKPDEVHSDTMRQSVIDNYSETILQRPRGPNAPMIFIGQRLHEADLPASHVKAEKMNVNGDRLFRSP